MGKSTGSIVVALIVGAAIGFVGGRASRPGGSDKPPTVADAKPTTPTNAPAQPAKPAQPQPAAQYFNVPFDKFQPSKGPEDAKVTIIEISDFQ